MAQVIPNQISIVLFFCKLNPSGYPYDDFTCQWGVIEFGALTGNADFIARVHLDHADAQGSL